MTIARDLLTGRATATIETQSRFSPVDGTAIERDFGTVCEVDRPTRRTPPRAAGTCRTTRDGHWTEARADVEIRSDEATFRVVVDLEVRVDGAAYATRHWDETIGRAQL